MLNGDDIKKATEVAFEKINTNVVNIVNINAVNMGKTIISLFNPNSVYLLSASPR